MPDDWRLVWRAWPMVDDESGEQICRIRWVCDTCEPNFFSNNKILEKYAAKQAHEEETLMFFDPETQTATGLVSFFGDRWRTRALFLAPGETEWQIATNAADFQERLTPLLVKANETWSLRLFFRNVDPESLNINSPMLPFEYLIHLVSERKQIPSWVMNDHAELSEAGTYHPSWFSIGMLTFDADVEAPKAGPSIGSMIAYRWTQEDELQLRSRVAEALNPPAARKTCEWCARPKKAVAYSTEFKDSPKGMIGVAWPKNDYSPETMCFFCAGLKPLKLENESPADTGEVGAAHAPSGSRSNIGRVHWQTFFKADQYLTQEQADARRVPTQDLVIKGQRLPQVVWGVFMQNLDRLERDAYIQALWEFGWSHMAIADAANITRERIRQIILQPRVRENKFPLPEPPKKIKKALPVYVEPNAKDLARLLELQPLAQQVRSNSPSFRAEAEDYTRLIAKVHLEDGVTLYRLAKRLGVTHGALRFRLVRYGYMQGAGQSKSYVKVKPENRLSKND